MLKDRFYSLEEIDRLEISQSLDGERTPMFKVKLKQNAKGTDELITNSFDKGYLFVFGDGRYSYLQGDKSDDRDAYKEMLSKWQESRAKA